MSDVNGNSDHEDEVTLPPEPRPDWTAAFRRRKAEAEEELQRLHGEAARHALELLGEE